MESEKMPAEIWAYRENEEHYTGWGQMDVYPDGVKYIRADLCATAGDAERARALALAAFNRMIIEQCLRDDLENIKSIDDCPLNDDEKLIRRMLGGAK